MEGPHRAVQANTGYAVPANPAPVANNTREDSKPLPLTAREGIAKRFPIKRDAAIAKKKTETAKAKAINQQNLEAQKSVKSLGGDVDATIARMMPAKKGKIAKY